MAPTLTAVRGRVETDLSDDAVTALIDEAVAEIESRFGPYRDTDNPITVTLEGRERRRLDLVRPVDTSETIVVREFHHWSATPVTLDPGDYLVRNGGRTLDRLITGSLRHRYWAHRVDVTYVPVDDTVKRDEVATKLVAIAISYDAAAERKVGDTMTRNIGIGAANTAHAPLIFTEEAEYVLETLRPRGGLFLR